MEVQFTVHMPFVNHTCGMAFIALIPSLHLFENMWKFPCQDMTAVDQQWQFLLAF